MEEKLKKLIHLAFSKGLLFLRDYYSIFIVSLICLFTVEFLNRPTDGIWDVFLWFQTNTRAALMNYSLYLIINVIFYLIINRLNIANILFFIAMNSLGLVNFNKLTLKGENLVFWDTFQAMDAVKAVTETHLDVNWQVVFVIMMMILVGLWQILGHRHRRRGTLRIKALFTSIVVLLSVTVGVIFNNDNLQRLYLTNYDWNFDENFKENGFILCYIMNLKNAVITKPAEYKKGNMKDIVLDMEEKLDLVEDIHYTNSDVENPNIIVVMCESFSNITVSNPGIQFEEDIMPNINNQDENIIKGHLVTSIFGGGTANSEFEFLTGNSCAFIPTGSVAYNTYIEETTDSIVPLLKERGYGAIAIHPYDRRFYHRNEIYEIFGFDEFITEEYFDENCERKKGYISDRSVYDMIVKQYEEKEEGKPLFTFTVTMENHTPYNDVSNGAIGVTYDDTIYNPGKIEQVAVHAKGVKDGDQLFGDLIQYFAQADEPTIVVLFGDHHPFVSNTINRNSSTLDEVTKFYTQYAIWANYDIETNTDYTLSSSCLSSVVLNVANIELPEYLQYNLYGATLLTGYNPYFVLDRNNQFYTYHDEKSEAIDTFLKNKELIQYDNLFGKQYSRNDVWVVKEQKEATIQE